MEQPEFLSRKTQHTLKPLPSAEDYLSLHSNQLALNKQDQESSGKTLAKNLTPAYSHEYHDENRYSKGGANTDMTEYKKQAVIVEIED